MTTATSDQSPVKPAGRVPGPSKMRDRKFEIIIDETLCRSCQLCIAFCPTQVLESTYPFRKAEVVNINACIGCRLCELLCPDWAVAMHEITPPSPAIAEG